MLRSALIAGALAVASSPALAYELRCRWVERIGSTDVVLGGDGAFHEFFDAFPHRIRLQFGVFDSASGAAPAGGFIGWNNGTLDLVPFGGPSPTATRTPGRLAPFNFTNGVNSNGNPPLPGGDPFSHLTQIDATLGLQAPSWGCGPDGQPLPMPQPVIRGLNTFVSVYEITTIQNQTQPVFDIVAGGSWYAAQSWQPVGTPFPPDCAAGEPGYVAWAPFPLGPFGFSCTLHLIIPAPGTALCLAGVLIRRTRRRRGRHIPLGISRGFC